MSGSSPRSAASAAPGAPSASGAPWAGGPGGRSIRPEELLDVADQMLTAPFPGLGPLWPRVCALLIRLALERSLDRYWARVLPEGAACGMRQQLLLLPQYTRSSPAANGAASLAREAWLGLAGAAHHHAYELAPTAGELRRWHTAVNRLNGLLTEEEPAGPPAVSIRRCVRPDAGRPPPGRGW